MRVLVVCALLALAAIHASNADLTIAYVDSSIHEVDSFDQIPPDALCWGFFNDTILAQGWSTLELHTQPSSPGQDYSDSDLAYCAGYLEGYLTAPRIAQTFRNLENFTASTSNAPLMNFVAQQSEFVLSNIENPPAGEESYWHHVHLLNVQTKGLRAGYIDNKLPTDESYSETDFFLVQIDDEIGDILTAVGAASVSKEPKFDMGRSGCSAFVRAVPDDLFISQITWTEFQTMLRVYKLYDFPWALSEDSKDLVPATRMSFSGYFGSLSSGDDYYQMNPSLLVSQETTNGVENGTLFQLYTTPSTNYEWVRTLLANRLASSAADWAKTFALYNSGTYNNQWMVLDYALYKQHKARGGSSKALPANLLVVAEQIPGTVAINDVTSFLNTRGYWASYNIPYDSNIFALSGYPQLLAQYGDFFSYEKCPRAQIFARDGPKVQTLADMQRIMRYNKFQTDPLSACDCTPPYSGENGIAARSDLNPANGTYPISALGHRCHGATDAKMTQLSLAEAGTTLAIVGPTYDDQPPFQWSLSDYHNLPHEGQPDLFKFDWMYIQWSDSAREIAAVNPHPVAAVA